MGQEKNMGKKAKEEKKDPDDHNVHTLLGQPALVQIVDRGLPGKSDQDKKDMIKKIANQCATFDGKGKLTVDDVYMSMDKNNDGQISKGELKLARKNLTMKQIESIIKKLDNNGDGTISLEEMKKGK